MKHFILSVLVVCCSFFSIAQADTTAPFRRYPSFPPVDLIQLDNKPLTKKDLTTTGPSMIFYFSPECEHCRHQMDDMIKRMKDFKKIHIVMATYQPLEQLQQFYSEYNLSRYNNIQVGRDTKFLLPPFYRIKNLPFLALYDKKGKLITTYEGNVKVETILKAYSKKS